MSRIHLEKDEKLVLENRYQSALPLVLIVCGAVLTLTSFIIGVAVCIDADDPSFVLGLVFGVALIVLGAYFKAKCEMVLTITNKRVCLDGPFDDFVYLPLNQITSIAIKGKALHVTAAGGRIMVTGGANNRDVCNVLMGLINQLQDAVAPVKAAAPAPKSTPAPKPVPVKAAEPPKPKKPFGDPTEYLGKKWCSGCGTVLPEESTACSECGSKYLSIITKTNMNNVLINLEEMAEERIKNDPDSTPICKCGAIPNRVGNRYVCPVCCRQF